MELGFLNDYKQIKGAIWCPGTGQSGFESLGAVVAGTVNPSGKTSDTFVYDLTATPTYNNFGNFLYDNMDEFAATSKNFGTGEEEATIPSFVNYVEGIYVGYRFYETAAVEGLIDYDKTVQFPFGYGLTYGKVVVTDAVVSENSAADINDTNVSGKAGFESGTNTTAAPVTIQATVTNQGSIDTRDVVQVYIKNVDSSLAVPNPELAAFTPVFLKAGETKTITLSIAPKAFTVVDETGARTAQPRRRHEDRRHGFEKVPHPEPPDTEPWSPTPSRS